MPLVAIVGWIAAAFSMSSGLPQLFRIIRTRSTEGLSVLMWQLQVAGIGGWVLYSFAVGTPQLIVPNTALFLTSVAVLRVIAKSRGLRLLPLLVWPLLLAGVLFGVHLLFGPLVFGIAVSVPLAVSQIAQLRYMMSVPDLSGVSLPYLVVAVIVQALWLTWAGLALEWAVLGCDVVMGSLCLANLVYYLVRRARGTAFVTSA